MVCAAAHPWKGEHGYELGPMGVSVALVEIVDCVPSVPSDAGCACIAPPDGWYSWHLRLVRRLPPIPVKGALGLFMPPAAVVSAAAA